MKAQTLWFSILQAQVETGTPYMLYKDACNSKSNQQVSAWWLISAFSSSSSSSFRQYYYHYPFSSFLLLIIIIINVIIISVFWSWVCLVYTCEWVTSMARGLGWGSKKCPTPQAPCCKLVTEYNKRDWFFIHCKLLQDCFCPLIFLNKAISLKIN